MTIKVTTHSSNFTFSAKFSLDKNVLGRPPNIALDVMYVLIEQSKLC